MSGGSDEPSLLRAVGVAGLAASIVNVTIGGGIFRLPALVAGSLHAQAPLAFVICGVAMGLIVFCFAEAGKRVELTGGPYAYVEVAFGPFAGYLAGILVWLLGCFAVAAVATVLADSVAALVPALAGSFARATLLLGTFALFTLVNIAGVRQGTRLNTIATVAKLLPLLLLIAAGAFAVRPEHLAWVEPVGAGTMARASILLIFAYSGVESALVPSGEIKDVRRTVPRAILVAMLSITGIYLALQIVAQGVLGADLAAAKTPLADAAARVLGPWGGTLLLVGSIVSMFGYVSGMTLAVPRCLYAFARDGVLPPVFGRVHPRFRTPHVAIAAQSALVCLLAITSGFERLAILANLVTLLLYAGCCLAAWRLAQQDAAASQAPSAERAGVLRVSLVALAACAVIGWMLTSITWPEWRVTFAMLLAASLLYALTSRSRAASSRAR